LKSTFEALDMSVELADVVLESFDPTLLLSKALTTFFLAVVDEFRNIVGQPFVLHVVDVGEGGTDGGDDGGSEGSRMQRCSCRSERYCGGVKEAGGSLDEMGFSRNGEEGGCVLLFIAVSHVLSDREEVGMLKAFLIGRVGPIRDRVPFVCDVGGTGRLTGRLSHSLGGSMVFAVDVAAKTRVLESVFSFGGMDVGLGRSIETDGLSFDDFGVSRRARTGLVGEVELERSQFTIL